MKDIEHLNMHIDWSALTKKEQITLHELLAKAHSAYEPETKDGKRRIYYKSKDGVIKPTNFAFDNAFDALIECSWLNNNTAEGVFGKFFVRCD